MLAIVGKATRNRKTDEVEQFLTEFTQMYAAKKHFVYAWSFNPNEEAINYLRESCDRHDEVFLYLPEEGGRSSLRMRVTDFHHDRATNGTPCPEKWGQYCIDELRNKRLLVSTPPKPIHLWFLIKDIQHIPIVNLRDAFQPIFEKKGKAKYATWKQNCFAFLRPA